MEEHPLLNREPLAAFGASVLEGLWREIDGFAPIPECRDLTFLGMAHGWAGVLFATMRWCQAAGRPLPGTLAERLGQLADLAEPAGRGLRWRRKLGRRTRAGSTAGSGLFDYVPSWCNGSAGFVFLWTLAHRLSGEERFLRLAEGAAFDAADDPDNAADLCCGTAGRAYALLALHRATGESAWLHRAQALAVRAARSVRAVTMRRDSLYKGEVAVAVLAADLERPEESAMPFFEAEGWR
jgi:serine/threonine-protein kinase